MKKWNKVFGVGVQRTGTSSLSAALNALGVKTSHWSDHEELSKDIERGIHRFKLLDTYDAVTDFPIPAIYKELDKQYPGSKFILTVRNVDSWYKSVRFLRNRRRFKGNAPVFNREERMFYSTDGLNRRVFKKRFLDHNQEVQDYFRDRKDDLLVMNICEGDGWEKLCKFLDLPVPDIAFPYHNKKKVLLFRQIDQKMGLFGAWLRRRSPVTHCFLTKCREKLLGRGCAEGIGRED